MNYDDPNAMVEIVNLIHTGPQDDKWSLRAIALAIINLRAEVRIFKDEIHRIKYPDD